MKTKTKQKFEGEIKPLTNTESFYMIVVEGSSYPAPTRRYSDYEEAFNESLRLAKKENKKTFVLLAVSQIELIPNVIQFTKIN